MTKHVEIDRHFIKEKIENELTCMSFILTKEQLTKILTEGLPKPTFEPFSHARFK